MESLFHDFRLAFRVLIKSPAFSLVAVVVLALGIGANTAIFSVVNAVLLRPLPFPEAPRLVKVWHTPPKSMEGMTIFAVASGNYLDWQKQNHVFDKMAIYSGRSFNITGTGKPEPVRAAAVTSDFLSVLRVRPALGRDFTPEEDQPAHNHVIILSQRFWKSHFGANPEIVGHNITLNGEAYLIAGVMPEAVHLPEYAQVWTPMGFTDEEKSVRGEHHYQVIARLKDGVDLKQAQAEMDTISGRLQQQYPADNKGWGALVTPLREDIVSDVRPALLVLLGAVAFVLLIACANVANLVLAKAVGRRKELAIRSALGASQFRVLQQILTETVLLSVAGGALGLLLARSSVPLIVSFLADKLPRSTEISLNTGVLLFTLSISILTGILAGLVPALRASHANLNDALKQGLGRTDADSGGNKTRSVLVVSEVALSLMLLIGAGLMIRSLWLLRNTDPGIDPHNILTMTLVIPGSRYPAPAPYVNFFDQVLTQVRSLPGVSSAGVVNDLPLSDNGSTQPIAVEGQPILPLAEQPDVAVRVVSTGYMQTMRIPVVHGRDLDETDRAGHKAVVLISESLARRFWPNQDAVGKRLTLSFFPDAVREVAGVVKDVKLLGLTYAQAVPTVYFPLAQISKPVPGGWNSYPLTLVVRGNVRPETLTAAITNAVHQVDAETPVTGVVTMEQYVGDSLAQQRFNMLLLAAFAGLALVLSAVGIYSVLSYNVRRRVREIGIRMALGAQRTDVVRLILFEGMKPTLMGLIIGLGGALALGRVLANLIYGISATDPATFGAVSSLLAFVALGASVVPAYRAARVEPMKSLRDE